MRKSLLLRYFFGFATKTYARSIAVVFRPNFVGPSSRFLAIVKRSGTAGVVTAAVLALGLIGGWGDWIAWADPPAEGSPPAGKFIPITHTNILGKIEGAVAVGASGAASWTTQLKIVPGVGGMQPSISISYDGGGYGGLGIGFSLNAGDAIVRCRRTVGQDGRQQPMTWTQDAPLCLGNSRLVAVSGTHGASGTEYRVQTDPNIRVKGFGNSVDAASGFAVYTPDGRVAHYGTASNYAWTQSSVQTAKINGAAVPFSWHIAFVQDRKSRNEMQYRYSGTALSDEDVATEQDHHLDRIDYGINNAVGQAATRQVRFEYASVESLLADVKPWEGPALMEHGYLSGAMYTRRQVLTRIEMHVRTQDDDWQFVRRYRLGYEPVPDIDGDIGSPDRVRLATLSECLQPPSGFGEDKMPCIRPTRFEWSTGPQQMVAMPDFGWSGASFYPLPPASQIESTPYRRAAMQVIADVDGDGKDDMMVMPETVNDAEPSSARWELWRTQADVHGPVKTNIPTWGAEGVWVNRAGSVVPSQGAITKYIDGVQVRPPEAVQYGYRRDEKATPGAWAMNYDGTGGTDILLGEPIHELAGSKMDPPVGVGWKTGATRRFANPANNGKDVLCTWSIYDWQKYKPCMDDLDQSRADYTGHPGFMRGLKILRLNSAEQGTFTETSLNLPFGQPLLWVAPPLDMNGDGLQDLMFCKADANYAEVAGVPMPMFYGPGSDPVNWVTGHMFYALNVPGQGIDLSQGGSPASPNKFSSDPMPCHAKDSYMVLDLYGDGRQSLLHRTHPHVGKKELYNLSPYVPAGTVADPYPKYPGSPNLSGYWQKQREKVWAEKLTGETAYMAFTYETGNGMAYRQTGLPYEYFMRWQHVGNTQARYSTHQAALPTDPDGGFVKDPPWGDTRDGRLTDWGSPDALMTGGGYSEARTADFNGDGLIDVAMVDLMACHYGQIVGETVSFPARPCSFQDVTEFGAELIEQTYEKLGVFVYLNRGDGSFDLGSATRLWDTDMPSAVHREVLENQYSKGLTPADINDIYKEAWTIATRATRGWRLEFASSLIGDPNGDGLADLGFIRMDFLATGGWLGDSMAGKYTMTPVWRLSRQSGGLSEVDTPMGLNIETLVPESAPTGWPGWQQDLMRNDTYWQEANASAGSLGPYAQQEYGLAARLLQLDVNGDGRAETAFFDHVRGRYELATPQGGDEPQANLLVAVTDGLGARTELDYAPQASLTWALNPWSSADIQLPYPWVSRPNTAPVVARLRTDTGLDAGNQPLYATTEYAYGKSVTDVRNGVGLGVDYHVVSRSVDTPSGTVNSVRVDRYDNSPSYNDLYKAYPMAGAPLSTTAMVWGDAGEPARIAHSGKRYSVASGLKPGTWRRQLDASTTTSYELDGALLGAKDLMLVCLAKTYDPSQQCVLGQGDSYQPLTHSETSFGYDPNGYGLVRSQVTAAMGSLNVSEREYENHDPSDPSGQEIYQLGLPTLEWVAHKPHPTANFVLRTTANDYYGDGQLKSSTIEPDRPQYRVKESFTYEGRGQLKSKTRTAAGSEDATTLYEYDWSGAYLTKVVNPLGHVETMRWFEGCGMPEQSTSASGHTTVLDVDALCRERGSQLFFGAQPLTRKITIHHQEWDPNGNEAYPDHEVWTVVEAEGGAKAHTISNRVGQKIVSQKPAFGFEVYTQTQYDPQGRPWRVSSPTQVGVQPTAWTETSYDAQGRVTRIQKPDGSAKTAAYRRNTTTGIDELGYTGSSETNAFGQIVKVSPPQSADPDPNEPSHDLAMCYAYGAFNTLVEAKPCTPTSAKSAHLMAYDDYGRLIRSEDGQAGVRYTRYDPHGRVDEAEDAQGQITKHRYDVLNRPVARIEGFGTMENKTAVWKYDESIPGTLARSINADGTVTKETLFDSYNRVVGATTTIHGRSFTTRVNYDGWGRVGGESFPSLSLLAPVQLWHQYNDWDQPIGLHHAAKLLWQPTKGDVWGNLTEQLYGNALTATAKYSPDTGRLLESQVQRKGWVTPDLYVNDVVDSFAYTWYDNGLIKMRIRKALGATENDQADQFHYNPSGELTGWTTLGAQQVVKQHYLKTDGFGNITDSPSGHYDYQNERLVKIEGPLGVLEYGYDDGLPSGNGNVTSRKHAGGTTTLAYDAMGRVSGIKDNQSSLKITYDADGNKVYVFDAYSGRKTFYVGGYQEERGGVLGPVVIGRYAFGPAHLTRTWAADFTYTDDLAYLPSADHLGSNTLVTDATGAVKDRRSYGVWGDERDPANWASYKAAPKDDLKNPNTGYTGVHERRQRGATAPGISGIVDMQARYYDPTAMQFLQPDTMIPDAYSTLAWNRRTYADNSPVAFSDPTGHAPQAANDPGIDVQRHLNDVYAGIVGATTGFARSNGIDIDLAFEVVGNAFTGTRQGAIGALRANKSKVRQERLLANKDRADMTPDEKYIHAAYLRDAANYKLAGMEAPFQDVDEYRLWRVISKEAQEMGLSSEMLDNMAHKAQTAASAVGFTTANPAKNPSTVAIQAGVKAGQRLSWLARVGDVFRSLRSTASVDLAKAFKEGKLFIGDGVIRAYGKVIGKVEQSGRQIRIEVDAKYASIENASALFKAGGQAKGTTVSFVFSTEAEAKVFERVVQEKQEMFVPPTDFRGKPGGLTVATTGYFADESQTDILYHVWIKQY